MAVWEQHRNLQTDCRRARLGKPPEAASEQEATEDTQPEDRFCSGLFTFRSF